MKKVLLILITLSFLSCEDKNQISKSEFENDLQEIFNLLLYTNNKGDKKLAYFFGSNVDSTSIYTNLVHGFNNQYLIYLTRKPFVDINLDNLIVEQDTISGTKQKVYNSAVTQQWFDFYKTTVAYYLKGKGITIQDYELPDPVLISQKELMEIVSKFFYVYNYEDSSGLQAKLCGGINPYTQEGLIVNPLVEAFAFQALVNILNEDISLVSEFYDGFVPELNLKVQEMDQENQDIVDFAKNYTYQNYERDTLLREKIISQYKLLQDGLAFKVSDL